jgi:hypothetical protein
MAWYGVPSAIWTFLDADIAIAVGIQYYHIAMIMLTIRIIVPTLAAFFVAKLEGFSPFCPF